jgi:hypothetical protein
MWHNIFRNIVTIPLICFFITGIYAQNTNPFEIRSRLDSVAALPVDQTNESLNDTLVLNDETSLNLNDSLSLESVNPFDVDHLPLRKSKLDLEKAKAVANQNNSPVKEQSNNFLFWILLLAAALLAIVINLNVTFIKLVFRSLINMNLFKLFHREEGSGFTPSFLFLYLVFFVNITTIVFLWLKQDDATLHFSFWLKILAGITGFYLAKHLFISVIGQIFSIEKTTGLYNFSISTYHIFAGILLLPLNFAIAFANPGISSFMLVLAMIFLAGMLILKTGRGLFISLEFWNDRFFQFFMYLCAFEILPVLILVKFLMYQVNH